MNVLVGIHPRLVDPALVQGVLDGEGAGLNGLLHLLPAGLLLSAGGQGQPHGRRQSQGGQPPCGHLLHDKTSLPRLRQILDRGHCSTGDIKFLSRPS